MVKALLLSPAYSWFVGLLVIMIVVTALFAVVLFIALKPIKREGAPSDAVYAKSLLDRREAELTAQLLKNQNNIEEMERLLGKLREVDTAERVIDELVQEEEGYGEPETKPVKKQVQVKKPTGATSANRAPQGGNTARPQPRAQQPQPRQNAPRPPQQVGQPKQTEQNPTNENK